MRDASNYSFILHICASFGIGGSLLLFLAVAIPAPIYRGRDSKRYSPLNHFISELGEVGVSRAAGFFNFCMIVAGWLFLPFAVGLGLAIGNAWAVLAVISGMETSIVCMLIGVFSMDQLDKHLKIAMLFFLSILVMVFLFTVSVILQPPATAIVPSAVNIFGILSVLVNLLYLLSLRPPSQVKISDVVLPDILKERPSVWVVPILEWLVLISTAVWKLSLSIALLRA